MANYTVELTEVEDKGMSSITASTQDWVENAVKNRARQAIDEIYNNEVARMTADPDISTIPADKNQIVLDADIETATEKPV
jgi:hypothetical protein